MVSRPKGAMRHRLDGVTQTDGRATPGAPVGAPPAATSRSPWPIGIAAVVALLAVIAVAAPVVFTGTSHHTARRPTLYTLSGHFTSYYGTECGRFAGKKVALTGPEGQVVGDTAPLGPGTLALDQSSCTFSYAIHDVPKLSEYRFVVPHVTGSNYSFDDLVRWRWQLDYWSTPYGDQEAIEAAWNRVNAANARGPLRGLQALSAVAWPTGAWTPQMIVCPTVGSTLAEALRRVIAPNAVVHDRPYLGEITPTPGWTPSAGPGAGRVPAGRIYSLLVDSSQTGTPGGQDLDHVVVSPDGAAHLFPRACGTPLENAD
jgi:hypothetical protein